MITPYHLSLHTAQGWSKFGYHRWSIFGCRYDTVAGKIVQITPRRVEHSFNQCIKRLALSNAFPKFIPAACEATDFETTLQFQGCGVISRERKVKARGAAKTVSSKPSR